MTQISYKFKNSSFLLFSSRKFNFILFKNYNFYSLQLTLLATRFGSKKSFVFAFPVERNTLCYSTLIQNFKFLFSKKNSLHSLALVQFVFRHTDSTLTKKNYKFYSIIVINLSGLGLASRVCRNYGKSNKQQLKQKHIVNTHRDKIISHIIYIDV